MEAAHAYEMVNYRIMLHHIQEKSYLQDDELSLRFHHVSKTELSLLFL
jgi:hypothetical protein